MPQQPAPVRIKRVYDPVAPDDGERVLVDRLWPRGVSKEAARLTLWLKDIAPSPDLRKWFGHDPAKYEVFRSRYLEELAQEPRASSLALLRAHSARGPVTLVFAAHDREHCNASVLRDLLTEGAER